MKIASLIIDPRVNAIYRASIPMEALARRGHHVEVETLGSLPRPDRYRGFDAICLWRRHDGQLQQFVRHLKSGRVAVLWDDDDPGCDVDVREPILRLADVVTTPSAVLADRLRAVGDVDVRVIDNHLRADFARPRRLGQKGVTIGWAALPDHGADADQLGLREALLRLLDEHGQLSVTTIGVPLEVAHPRWRRLGVVQYERLPGELARFDVGLAPLAATPVNEARSSVKLKEYAALGVPWLASPVGAYAAMGPRQGGELVADGDWQRALGALVADPARRSRLAAAGKAWAQRQTIVYHELEWEQAVKDAVRRARQSAVAQR